MSHPNRTIGDFEIIRELGRGGMGVVYEAKQVSLNRTVALKVLANSLGLSSRAIKRFKREAESAAKLHHTNIVPVYSIGEEDGVHFYAMELIDGPSLDKVIGNSAGANQATMSLNGMAATEDSCEAAATEGDSGDSTTGSISSTSTFGSTQQFDDIARLIAEIADALGYAHEQGIVHRDIKPSNLMLGPNGKLSINDFGLARVLEAPNMTATGEMLGTPAYMSPEQITAGRTPLDHRTDIYSLGATLYEMLTLQPPFKGERRDQLLAQILHKDPTPPRRINKKIPVDLETICLKSIDKDPDKRYQTARDLAKNLERFVNRFEISARRVGPVGKSVKWLRRHPGIAFGATIAATGVLLACVFAYHAIQSERQRMAIELESKESLRVAKLDAALEDAMRTASSGDFEKARSAIRTAEKLGASNSSVRRLRGLVAYFSGDFELALEEARQSAELDPNSAASLGLLALTHVHLSHSEEYRKELSKLDTVVPKSEADFLFKSYAYYYLDPSKSLKIIQSSPHTTRSPLLDVAFSEVTACIGDDRSDKGMIVQAEERIRAAEAYMPNNPFVISVKLYVYLVAKHYFNTTGNQAEVVRCDRECARCVEQLTPNEHLPFAGMTLWLYYRQNLDAEATFEFARRLFLKSKLPKFVIRYAHLLCRRGEFQAALKVLQQRRWKESYGDQLQAFVLAELHPTDTSRALKAARQIVDDHAGKMTFEYGDSPTDSYRKMLLVLGEYDEAAALYQEALSSLPADAVEEPRFRLVFDDNAVAEAIDSMEGNWTTSNCYNYIAFKNLAVGKRTEALKWFRKCLEHPLEDYMPYEFTMTCMSRLEQDPTWPPWIPMREDATAEDAKAAEATAP